MPHQNRVTPFNRLIATPERGTLTGNRGRLHNADGRIIRSWRGTRWIICLLQFKGRRHPIMQPGHYTNLFFLDEATALSAGHRPCAECQRGRFNLFRELWARANPEKTSEERPPATVIDEVLHRERTNLRKGCTTLDGLPDGTMITDDGFAVYLIVGGNALRWTPGGYEPADKAGIDFPAAILTVESIVETLRAGYPVDIHPSAFA